MKLTRRSVALLLAAAALFRGRTSSAAEAGKDVPAPAPSEPATLPKDVVWATNNDDPIIGSEKAIRGGKLNLGIWNYPLTFRLNGPNANDNFAAWNRAFTVAFTLVGQHPVTDKFIPIM